MFATGMVDSKEYEITKIYYNIHLNNVTSNTYDNAYSLTDLPIIDKMFYNLDKYIS